MFLMPSRFEPCGLNQMYSLRYGTVPIVHAVGGLDDTIQPYTARARRANGFKFREPTADGAGRASVRQAVAAVSRSRGVGPTHAARHDRRPLMGDLGPGICQSVQTGSTRRGHPMRPQ